MRNYVLIAVFISVAAWSAVSGQDAPTVWGTGKTLFSTNCVKCHGEDGTRGRWGAKNLQSSRLGDEALLTVISNGRGIMPRWSKKLDHNQVIALVVYIKTLRNH